MVKYGFDTEKHLLGFGEAFVTCLREGFVIVVVKILEQERGLEMGQSSLGMWDWVK